MAMTRLPVPLIAAIMLIVGVGILFAWLFAFAYKRTRHEMSLLQRKKNFRIETDQAQSNWVGDEAGIWPDAIKEFCKVTSPTTVKVLDFGCGRGWLVHTLARLGFDAYGCDITVTARWGDGDFHPDPDGAFPPDWSQLDHSVSGRCRTISSRPYRLPFLDNTFDVVLSTAVFEHAQNKEECFQEIYRVLKPGGYSMHIFPAKWRLPYEPHIFVPLMNYFWPRCPQWWLTLWALLGVRNAFQQNLSWRAVVTDNSRYCRQGLSYWTTSQYQKLSRNVFGNCYWPMEFYIRHGEGGFARLCNRLPFKALAGVLGREFREAFMVQQKRV